eukprot:scaffold1318_cov362-Pavlova_lutheri.AAC.24
MFHFERVDPSSIRLCILRTSAGFDSLGYSKGTVFPVRPWWWWGWGWRPTKTGNGTAEVPMDRALIASIQSRAVCGWWREEGNDPTALLLRLQWARLLTPTKPVGTDPMGRFDRRRRRQVRPVAFPTRDGKMIRVPWRRFEDRVPGGTGGTGLDVPWVRSVLPTSHPRVGKGERRSTALLKGMADRGAVGPSRMGTSNGIGAKPEPGEKKGRRVHLPKDGDRSPLSSACA